MIIPRYYQEEAIQISLRKLKANHPPFVLSMPTGSGKSVIISELCHRIDQPTLILQPTKEILLQNFNKLLEYGVMDIDIYSASVRRKNISKFTYATIGSIFRKPELFKHFRLLIIDECHLTDPQNNEGMYARFIRESGITKVVGLTATPYRMVNKQIYTNKFCGTSSFIVPLTRIYPAFFREIAYSISVNSLIENKFLAPIDYTLKDSIDISGIKINSTGSDYDEMSIEEFWTQDKNKIIAQIVEGIDKDVNHNLIFVSTVKQAENVAEILKERGLSVEVVSSLNDSSSRDRIISFFKKGLVKHIVNVGVLTTGFDFPALDCITLARPTFSLSLYYQMVGRGLRIFPGKMSCKVIDVVSNVYRLGRIETIQMKKEKGFKDTIHTEIGQISGQPIRLFSKGR